MKNIWRIRFIECCEQIYRELGFSPPAMQHDESLPLVMELEHAGHHFELLHSPSNSQEKTLVISILGELPDENILQGTRNLLKRNLMLVRAHEAAFGVNADNNSIYCMYHESLDHCSARAWLEKMKNIVTDATEIKKSCFSKNRQGNLNFSPAVTFTLA